MENKLIYITQSGTLSRKDNTLYFKNESTQKTIPIIGIEQIFCLAEVTINSKLLAYLTEHKINLHFCNYHEYYIGSYVPKDSYVSGSLLIKQVEHYVDNSKRLEIAVAIVIGISENMVNMLEHYQRHWKPVASHIKLLKKQIMWLHLCTDINQILSTEWSLWQIFYDSFRYIVVDEFEFETRKRRPPDNPMNALISFWNSLLYAYTLSKIYHTQLNPTIAYLHSAWERRFSLALDICEVFKIPLVFGTIFTLINRKMIQVDKHFDISLNCALLNEEWRKIFCRAWDERLAKALDHPILKKKTSYGSMIKYDCYKLIKHLLWEKKFIPFSLKEGF